MKKTKKINLEIHDTKINLVKRINIILKIHKQYQKIYRH